jgi:hypothetical protein
MNSFQLVLSPEKICPWTWETSDAFSLSTSIPNGGFMVSYLGTAVAKTELKRIASIYSYPIFELFSFQWWIF